MFSKDTLEACLTVISDRVNQSVPNVNCGGCGIFAVELVKRLERIGVKDAQIRCYGGNRDVNVSEVDANFNGNYPESLQPWTDNGIYFHHVRVEWNGKVYDAGSVDSNTNDWRWCNLLNGSVSRKAMEVLIRRKANWNRTFKRWRNLGKIRSIMDDTFSEFGMAV